MNELAIAIRYQTESKTCMRSFRCLLDLGARLVIGYPIQRIEDGLRSVLRIFLTFSSSIMPTHIELSPNADDAN